VQILVIAAESSGSAAEDSGSVAGYFGLSVAGLMLEGWGKGQVHGSTPQVPDGLLQS
jgi:hypothetical protein